MKPRFLLCGVLAAAAVATLWLAPVRVAAQAATAQGAAVPVPRTADGRPDYSGVWIQPAAPPPVDENGNYYAPSNARNKSPENSERDASIRDRGVKNKPLYKPEYWDRVQYLDHEGNAEDPAFHCLPQGVPRMGPPAKIIQTPKELIFLYQARNTFRVIPIDAALPPKELWDGKWMGDSVAHFEGDALVVETANFEDQSWLAYPGWFHSRNMRVTERFVRQGNSIRYQATVEDPVMLRPFVMDPRTINLNTDPNAKLEEDLPCSERDAEHLVTHERG